MSLSFVPYAELERIRGLDADSAERAAAFADACRINVLHMVQVAGSGHLGSSFSCIDMLAWLHLEVLGEGDRYYSSKGHDAPALYAVLIGLGVLPFEKLDGLRRLGGLPGHPDVLTTPQVHTNTGSLGMGISKARGFLQADRLAGRAGRVFVLTGDGELQEGQFWESLQPAVNAGAGAITAIVDHNKVQSDTWVEAVSDLGDLEAKLRAFGWAVGRCDGNDIAAFAAALRELDERAGADQPRILIADTLKGAGVTFMEPGDLPPGDEGLYAFHSGAPSPEVHERAVAEVRERLDARMARLGEQPVALEARAAAAPAAAPASSRVQRIVPAYGRALLEIAERDERVVALDADLRLDTGLVDFRSRLPERFFECGIAEQDMVSAAGAMALSGLVPVCHSFACFLSTRPNEQIFNNATEGTKVIYAGSLAGLVPGGPGHSHQSVRDISALAAMPGMALAEPSTEREAELLIAWAVEQATGPVYLRLGSVPWELPFDPPEPEQVVPGRGELVREGEDAVIVTTGPVMLAQAWLAAELLAAEGTGCGVVALPWLNDVDGGWLAGITGDAAVVCLDNHWVVGGQGDALRAALPGREVTVAGIDRVPDCGTNDEVLRSHGLDGASVAERVRRGVEGRR